MSRPLMRCGHAANGQVRLTGQDAFRPACVICAGLTPTALEVDDSPPSLEGRMAICDLYRGCTSRPVPSSTDLAFFEHRPGREFDQYYCGCRGWD